MEQNYIIENWKCIVCLEQIKINELKKSFFCKCFYEIHEDCFKKYYETTNKCMICKQIYYESIYKKIEYILKEYQTIINDYQILKKYMPFFLLNGIKMNHDKFIILWKKRKSYLVHKHFCNMNNENELKLYIECLKFEIWQNKKRFNKSLLKQIIKGMEYISTINFFVFDVNIII